MHESGELPLSGDLDAALAGWRDHLAHERNASPRTIDAYERDWRQLCGWLAHRLGHAPCLGDVRQLSAQAIRAFLAHRRRAGVENRSLARSMSSFRQFFRWLEANATLKNHAILKVSTPRVPRGLPKPLTVAKAVDVVAEDSATNIDWIRRPRYGRAAAALRRRPAHFRGAGPAARRRADTRPRRAAHHRKGRQGTPGPDPSRDPGGGRALSRALPVPARTRRADFPGAKGGRYRRASSSF